MRTLLAALCLVVLGPTGLRGEINVKDYRVIMASANQVEIARMKAHISGLGIGISWANTEAKSKKAPLYCQPEKLALGVDNWMNMINDQIQMRIERQNPAENVDEDLLGFLLLKELMSTFPCASK